MIKNQGLESSWKLAGSGINQSNKSQEHEGFIVKRKQGKISDLPKQPRALSMSRKRTSQLYKNTPSRQTKIQHASMTSPKQFKAQQNTESPQKGFTKNEGTAKKSFYSYCQEETMKLSQNNIILEKQINDLQAEIQKQGLLNRKLQSEKGRIQNHVQSLTIKKIMQKQTIRTLEARLNGQIQKTETYSNSIKSHLLPNMLGKLDLLMRSFDEKNNRNARQLDEISFLQYENTKLKQLQQENKHLNKQYMDLLTKYSDLKQKINCDKTVVSHLWQVKNIEYGNLMELIDKIDFQQ